MTPMIPLFSMVLHLFGTKRVAGLTSVNHNTTKVKSILQHVNSTSTKRQVGDPPLPRPMDLILDFDGTVTVHDTIQTLADFAIRTNTPHHDDPGPTWIQIVTSYSRDYSEY